MMKGYVGKFIITILMFGMFSLLFIALNEAYDPLHDFALGQITDAGSQNTITIMNIMWIWLPITVLFGFLVWVISQAKKQEGLTFA